MPDTATHYLETHDLLFPAGKGALVESSSLSGDDRRLADMVSRVKVGDAIAFENLISFTRKKAFGLAWHLTGDFHCAQDLLQEAYLRIFRSIGTLRSASAFKSWMARIITNLARDFQSRRKEKPLEEQELQKAAQDPSSPLCDEAVLRSTVQQALFDLPVKERTIVVLREYYGLSYEEMSSVLKIPLGTVKSRLNEARKKFVEMIMRREDKDYDVR